MRVLVTGGSGFIGRSVVAALQARTDTDITVASRQRPAWLGPQVHHQACDLLAPGAAAELIQASRPTHLMHLAWNAAPGAFWTARDNIDWSAATMALTSQFLAAGGQGAVFAGSCAEYSWRAEGRLGPSTPMEPHTHYGIAKDATRRLVCSAGAQQGVPIAWGRIFWLYGPNEAPGRLVSDVIAALMSGKPVETTEGHQRRDFIHVDDAGRALVAALESGWHGPFNVGSGQAAPVRTIIETLAQEIGRAELVHFGARPAPKDDPPVLEADTEALERQIHFAAQRPLAEGLRQTVVWWREHPERVPKRQ